MNLTDEIRNSFREGSSLIKLIYINLGVFLAVKIIFILLFLLNSPSSATHVITWLAVPANLNNLLHRFWTPITYMFFHEGFIHILFNLLWLYWFGRIFLEYFDQKKLVTVYLLGGLSGAFLYVISFNLFPAFAEILDQSVALGASASVMAIVVASAVYVPNYVVRLILIGPVQIKYIALVVFIFTSILDFSTNTGGKIAHIGGALLGYFYTLQYKRGKDIGKGFDRFMDWFFSLFKKRSKMKVTYKKPPKDDLDYNKMKADEQEEIDRILEKISKGGYDSLTKSEKETLFKMSDKK
jgi:membrane associated rhomboid family serine protease